MRGHYTPILISVPVAVLIWIAVYKFVTPEKQQISKLPDEPSDIQLREIHSNESDPATDSVAESVTESAKKSEPELGSAQLSEIMDDTVGDSGGDVEGDTGLQKLEPGEEYGLTVIFGSGDQSCAQAQNGVGPVKVIFNRNSAGMKGKTLIRLEDLIKQYNDCEGGVLILDYIADDSEWHRLLKQRRLDEVNYHLQHMGIRKSDIVLAE